MTTAILIISADAQDQAELQHVLLEGGHSVYVANTLTEGLDLMMEVPLAAILLDTNLPVGSEMQLLLELKTWSLDTQASVVILVNPGDGENTARILRAGAKDYLVKDEGGGHLHLLPFVIDRLLAERKERTRQRLTEQELSHYRLHLESRVEQRTAALMKEEAKTRLLLQASADGLYGVDSEGRVFFVNPAACTMVGLPETAILGRKADTVFLYRHADGTLSRTNEDTLQQVLQCGGTIRVEDEVLWSAQGAPTPVMYAAHALRQGAEIIGAVISLVDVTTQRGVYQVLEEALAAVKNLVKLQSQFLANLSQKLRTPLTGVMGYAHLGQRRGDADEATQQAFERILLSGNQLLDVVSDATDLAEMSACELRGSVTDYAPAQVVEQAVTPLLPLVEVREIALRVRINPSLPATCKGDPHRVRLVLHKLLANAINRTTAGEVILDVTHDAEYLEFRIKDNGKGIPTESVNRAITWNIADPLGTVGAGLGLSICHRLVTQMEGDLHGELNESGGNTFKFWTPLELKPPVDYPPDTRLAGAIILLAEDDLSSQEVIASMLESAGATVLRAADGVAALALVLDKGADRFDLVLTDLCMPKLDGYTLAKQLGVTAPGLPIVGQTAQVDEHTLRRCRSVGMRDCLAKPIDYEQVVTMVATNLRPRAYETP